MNTMMFWLGVLVGLVAGPCLLFLGYLVAVAVIYQDPEPKDTWPEP